MWYIQTFSAGDIACFACGMVKIIKLLKYERCFRGLIFFFFFWLKRTQEARQGKVVKTGDLVSDISRVIRLHITYSTVYITRFSATPWKVLFYQALVKKLFFWKKIKKFGAQRLRYLTLFPAWFHLARNWNASEMKPSNNPEGGVY